MRKTVFTTAGKLVDDSIALSFSESAKQNCDDCRLWKACYASRLERIYKDLRLKLRRHFRNGGTWVVNRAIAQMGDSPIRWARMSVDGSLPNRWRFNAREWSMFVKRLRVLVRAAMERGAKWHVPVESSGKARSYRVALEGLGVVVRRTSQSARFGAVLRQDDHRAWVVAERIHKGHVSSAEKKRNVCEAYRLAKVAREAGVSTVVCGAIAGDTKCGQCTACAEPLVELILYPFHP